MAYDFHYTPTGTGVISGKEVLEQTEDAINDLGNTAISGVQEALDKAEQALTNSANAVDDAQTALNTANNAEGVAIQAQTDVGNLSGTVTNIGNRVTTAEGNISNLQGRMTTAEGNITNIQGRMTTAETNIGNLQTAVSTAQATANSAQQTATTARQQSYVFRYSGTAVVPNSTIAYSTIDNTDNIKSGDKILDVDGKLFEITAVDTTNQTVTVGSALIDLALDGNVVHLSGSETISGAKTFSSNVNVYNSDSATDTANIILKNSKAERGSTTNIGEQTIFFLDKDNTQLGQIICNVDSNGYSNISIRCSDLNNVSAGVEVRKTITGSVFRPTNDNQCWLGQDGRRWYNTSTSKINGLTPSSLGMPTDNIANIIDISGYLTVLDGSQANTYQAPDNGYIGISMSNCSGIQCFITGFWGNQIVRPNSGVVRFFMPICKNMTTNILVFGGTIDNARFFPCQGNI